MDYVRDVLGVARSYGPELRDTGQFGFLLPEDQLLACGEENYAAVKSLANDLLTKK